MYGPTITGWELTSMTRAHSQQFRQWKCEAHIIQEYLGMGNSGAVTEPVPPEPHIMNIVSSTRLELNKTRKDTSCCDNSNQNTKFSLSKIELIQLKAEGVETGDWGSNKQLVWYPLTVEGKVTKLRVSEWEEHWKGKNEMEGQIGQ